MSGYGHTFLAMVFLLYAFFGESVMMVYAIAAMVMAAFGREELDPYHHLICLGTIWWSGTDYQMSHVSCQFCRLEVVAAQCLLMSKKIFCCFKSPCRLMMASKCDG